MVHRCTAKAISDCLTLLKCVEKILELFKFAEKNWQSSFDSHRLPRDIEMSSEVKSNPVFNRARQYLLLIIQLIYSAVGGSFPITHPLGWERTFTNTEYVIIERLFRKKCHNTWIQAFWLWALCPQGSPGVDQILFKDGLCTTWTINTLRLFFFSTTTSVQKKALWQRHCIGSSCPHIRPNWWFREWGQLAPNFVHGEQVLSAWDLDGGVGLVPRVHLEHRQIWRGSQRTS